MFNFALALVALVVSIGGYFLPINASNERAGANSTISGLTSGTSLSGSDLMVYVDNSGTPTTKKITIANATSSLKTLYDTLYSPIFSSSAGLAGLLSDEQGSAGGFVRATSPTITTPSLTTPTITTSIIMPVGTAPTVNTAGNIAIDTTEGQLLAFGNYKMVFVATSTRGYAHSATTTVGTTTVLFPLPENNATITRLRCHTNTGTSRFDFYNGTASSSMNCSTSAAQSWLTSNNTVSTTTATARIGIGTLSAATTQTLIEIDYLMDAN